MLAASHAPSAMIPRGDFGVIAVLQLMDPSALGVVRKVANIQPTYASIECVRDICEPWIQHWGGDEWGESMYSLHSAAHTSYGFSDEDCALFAAKLLENLCDQKEWIVDEGKDYGFCEPDEIAAVQAKCRELRDYWRKGGNLSSWEPAVKAANTTVDTLPGWLFGDDALI